MKNIGIPWVGEAPTDSWDRLVAFAEVETSIGEASYKRLERDPGFTYLRGFTSDAE